MIVIEKGGNADIWAGDGPKYKTPCVPTSGVATPSTLWVLNRHTGAVRGTINTGANCKTTGNCGNWRADELCYGQSPDVVLIANPGTSPSAITGGLVQDQYITFVGEDNLKILGQIEFRDGKDPNAGPFAGMIAGGGIEQCAFNPRDGKFYISIPATKADGSGPGVVLRISGQAPFKVEQVFSVDPTCGGANGLVIGPDHQIGLGCNFPGATNSEIMDDRNGGVIKLIPGNGVDEAWFNPGSNHYYFAISGPPGQLAVADAQPPSADPTIATAAGSHSVAADPIRN